MRNSHGEFIWYELLTSDPDAATEFYAKVVGWSARGAGQSGMDYRIWSCGGVDIGGLMALPPGAPAAGMQPGWLGYTGVDDVDASVARLTSAGGSVQMPAMDIPDVGRIAMVADPQGAVFYIMRGAVDGVSAAFNPGKTGHCGWNELHTTDGAAALAFYASQYGWKDDGTFDMGSMGSYHLFKIGNVQAGGIMTDPQFSKPMWIYYFAVGDIDAAASRIALAGGRILLGPIEVPGGDWIINGVDPQGAMFALVGSRD